MGMLEFALELQDNVFLLAIKASFESNQRLSSFFWFLRGI